MEKLTSVMVKRVIEFDYTEAINEMIEDGEIENEKDIEDNVCEWFADDSKYFTDYTLDIEIKP